MLHEVWHSWPLVSEIRVSPLLCLKYITQTAKKSFIMKEITGRNKKLLYEDKKAYYIAHT